MLFIIFGLLPSSDSLSIFLLGSSPTSQDAVDANLQKLTQLVNKESNLIEKVLPKSAFTFPCDHLLLSSSRGHLEMTEV